MVAFTSTFGTWSQWLRCLALLGSYGGYGSYSPRQKISTYTSPQLFNENVKNNSSKFIMDHSQCHIAIVGAGPSGLLLARILELAGIEYIVFERDESAKLATEYSSSGTLDIHKDTGQVALEDAGLMDEFRSAARYFVPAKIADGSGIVYSSDPGDKKSTKPEIDRRVLHRILLSSIPASRV